MSSSVDPNSTTQLSSAARRIPIIVVPGIMGTRLSEPDGDHGVVWNPKGWPSGDSPGYFWADSTRIANINAPLAPDEWNTDGYDPGKAARAEEITNFYHLIPDFYDELCLQLLEQLRYAPEFKEQGLEPRVYCCGYDWRTYNQLSAQRLYNLVQQAQQECAGEKVILVAHSMGGIVCRYFCKVLGGDSMVRALFLLGSPSLGAVQPYAYLKRGLLEEDDPDMYALRKWVWWQFTDKASLDFNRGLPALYQVLPNHVYCQADPSWLTFDSSQTGYPWIAGGDPVPFTDASAPYVLYKDIYVGFGEEASNRTLYGIYSDIAGILHGLMSPEGKAYMPKDATYCFPCTDLDTTAKANLPAYGEIVNISNFNQYGDENWGRMAMAYIGGAASASPYVFKVPPLEITKEKGDGSVPNLSGNPEAALLSNPFKVVQTISGVAHGDLPNDPQVYNQVINLIRLMDFDAEREEEIEEPAQDAPVEGGGGDEPEWIPIAEAEVGTKEISGSEHNARIVEYHSTTGGFTDDETPWCSSFVNWCMEEAGYSGTGSALALSWTSWGKDAGSPAYGAIAVIDWGGGKGHVGFVVGKSGSNISLLGGNQSDAVNTSSFSESLFVAWRFPSDYEIPADAYNLDGGGSTEDGGGVDQTR